MTKPLAVIIVEDSENDALLVARMLRKAGYDLSLERVETAGQMQAALARQEWDIVISDYSLPRFSGYAALALLQQSGRDIPFIAISGTIGEETAVAMMRAGAHDYLMKDNLSRLIPAVERELEQARVRRASRQAEQAIQVKDTLLRLTGEIARVGGWEYDLATQAVMWTDEVWRIHDLEPGEEMSIARALGFYTPESREKLECALQAAATAGVPYDLELEIITARSAHKTVHTKGLPELENGRVVRLRGIVHDITDLRQREMELRVEERKYQTLAESAPVGIFRTDAAGATTYVSPRWSEISGLSFDQAMGYGWLDAIHPDDRAKVDAGWNQAAAAALGSIKEYRYLRPDGSIAWVLGQAVPEEDADGRVLGYVGTITDITENRRAQERIETQLRRLGALREIDAAITASLDLDHTLNVLLEQMTIQLGMDATSVLLLDQNQQELVYAAGCGFRTSGISTTRLKLSQSFAGQAAVDRRPVYIDSYAGLKAGLTDAFDLDTEGFVAYYGAPLVAKDEVKGVLEVFHRTPYAADEEWFEFFNMLAKQAAIAIDSAQLFASLQHSNLELSQSYDATIEGWSHALDLRDKETEGHTLRVTLITEQLARAMGVDEADLVHVRRGALLHDIGKLGVPDSILLKPAALTPAEWAVMRRHPEFARSMLVKIAYLRPALDIPYLHHEKWDGSGYPNGLVGEQIPLAARIFAVVDVWDALRSDRPYRDAWPNDKVLEHIRSLSGAHFDPQVVRAFLALMGENGNRSD